jgi:hypothetical protein
MPTAALLNTPCSQEVVGVVGEEQLPGNVVCCPDACPFTMGFTPSFQHCEAVFSRHFPGVRWVGPSRGGLGHRGCGLVG